MSFGLKIATLTAALLLHTIDAKIAPESYHGEVEFIQEIDLNGSFGTKSLNELSGLTYDKKNKILYAVSDKGKLFSYKLQQKSNKLTLSPIHSCKLKNRNGKRLKKWQRDSEGVALDSNGKLFISFEGKPKIYNFTKKCIQKKQIKLPRSLKNAKLLSSNKSLEALAFHPKYEFITALEYPKKSDNRYFQTIYTTSGKQWHLKLDPIKKNAIVAIEVMDDGNLLILERAHKNFFDFIITLEKLYINGCKQSLCKQRKILQMDSQKGWRLEDFEGLANLGAGKFVMVSDNSNSIFFKTKLVYFKINKSNK